MKYRNDRIAKNEDPVVHIDDDGAVIGVGILYDLEPNREDQEIIIEAPGGESWSAPLRECLHVEDAGDILDAEATE